MNDRITLCLDREFAEDLNIALHDVLCFLEDCEVFDSSVSEPLDDFHLVLEIYLNCRVI